MKQKILTALAKLNTLEDVDYLIDKIRTTRKINRRKKVGRELTEELVAECNKHARYLIKKYNLTPF